MLEILSTVFGSILGGGATGLLGVAFQRFADYKNRQLDLQLDKQRNEHEASMRDKDAAIMAQEWAARTKIADTEAEADKDVAESNAFAASFKMEPARFSGAVKPTRGQGWLLVLLDLLRGVVRPGLTVYLCAITTLIYLDIKVLLDSKSAWSGTEAFTLMHTIIQTVLYLTTTCVLWWFGTRNKQAPPKAQ